MSGPRKKRRADGTISEGGRIEPLKVEARWYVHALLHGATVRGGRDRGTLLDLALVGLRVVVERGDAPSIFFDEGQEYPS